MKLSPFVGIAYFEQHDSLSVSIWNLGCNHSGSPGFGLSGGNSLVNQQQRANTACTLQLQLSVFGASRPQVQPGQPRGGAGASLDKDSLDWEAAAKLSQQQQFTFLFVFTLFMKHLMDFCGLWCPGLRPDSAFLTTPQNYFCKAINHISSYPTYCCCVLDCSENPKERLCILLSHPIAQQCCSISILVYIESDSFSLYLQLFIHSL